MKIIMNNLFRIVIILFAVTLLFLSFQQEQENFSIWLEVEDAIEITDPLIIEKKPDVSGGKIIRSIGISHKVLGYASYELNIPKDGNYIVWGRCFWPAGCSNSFLIQLDNSSKFLIGNNLPFNRWHWVVGPSVFLSKGTHMLYLWNEEQDSQIDKFLITNNNNIIPTGFGSIDNYYVDFEGESTIPFNALTSDRWLIAKSDKTLKDPIYYSLGKTTVYLHSIEKQRNKQFQNYDENNFKNLQVQNCKNPKMLIKKIKNNLSLFLKDTQNPLLQEQLNFHDETRKFSRNLIKDIADEIHIRSTLDRESKLNTLLYGEFEKNRAYYLTPNTFEKFEYSLFETNADTNYVFKGEFKFGKQIQETNLFLLYNFIDKKNYSFLKISHLQCQLGKVAQGIETIISNMPTSNSIFTIHNTFSNFCIIKNGEKTTVNINGRTLFSVSDSTFQYGKIGIASTWGDVFFDDLSYISNTAPYLEENFFETFKFAYLIKDWLPLTGFWKSPRYSRSLHGQRLSEKPASIIFGKQYWSNYSVTLAAKPPDLAGFGVNICYQDSLNNYLIKFMQDKVQLIKSENGVPIIVDEGIIKAFPGYWYKIKVKKIKDSIKVYIDDFLVIEAIDDTFECGKIGLWVDSEQEVQFGHVIVAPVENELKDKSKSLDYTFNTRERVALDFCDWLPNENKRGVDYLNDNLVWKKEYFDKTFLVNKKYFQPNIKLGLHMTFLEKNDQNIFHVLFFGVKNNNRVLYNFQFKKESLNLYIDGKKILSTNFRFLERLAINFDGKTWQVLQNGRPILSYDDIHKIDYAQIGIGFTGISKVKAKINNLTIKAVNYFNMKPTNPDNIFVLINQSGQ